MDGTSKKTPRMSDQFLQGTIQVSGGKNMATGLVIPSQTRKNPTWGTRKVKTSAAGDNLIGQKDGDRG